MADPSAARKKSENDGGASRGAQINGRKAQAMAEPASQWAKGENDGGASRGAQVNWRKGESDGGTSLCAQVSGRVSEPCEHSFRVPESCAEENCVKPCAQSNILS